MAKGQGGSINCREDRRPHKYTINIKRLRGDNMSTRDERVDFEAENGVTLAPSTGRLSRPMNHPNKPSNKPSVDFDLFWENYPIKVGKQAARKAWDKATQQEQPDVIIRGAIQYATDPNRHPSFTAHASTWLNAARWNDPLLPPRVLSLDEKRAAELEISREKTRKERMEYQNWKIEQEKAQARAVPAPAGLKELLKQTIRK
jgi:hypothetical protein